jgi:hypothetical protein
MFASSFSYKKWEDRYLLSFRGVLWVLVVLEVLEVLEVREVLI